MDFVDRSLAHLVVCTYPRSVNAYRSRSRAAASARPNQYYTYGCERFLPRQANGTHAIIISNGCNLDCDVGTKAFSATELACKVREVLDS